MFDNLSGLAYGIVTFAIVAGIGFVVISKFGTAQLTCPEDKSGTNWDINSTATGVLDNHYCYNASGFKAGTTNVTSAQDQYGANATTGYLNMQLGSEGLVGYTPAVIALAIGMLFLGAFLGKGKRAV